MPRLQRDRGVAHRARALDVRGLWTSGVGDRGHHFPGDPYSVVRLVPGDLVGGQPKKWRQRAWPAASSRLGQLPHGLDVAAPPTRDGAAWHRTGCRRRSRWTRPSWAGSIGRGAGPGHRPTPDAAGGRCLSRQPAYVRAARGATWLGGDHRRAPKLSPPAQARLSPRPESLLGRGEFGRRSCLASTGSRRSSERWLLGTHQGGVSPSISTITSTSSPFGSIDEPHAIAGSSSIGSWSRPWRWVPFPTRWSRVSVAGRRNATTTGSRYLSKGNTPMSPSVDLSFGRLTVSRRPFFA